jgi:hypothetical protein
MIHNSENSRKVLLLLSQPFLFNAAKRVLQSQGFTVIEFGESDKPDVVYLDSFFLASGAAEHLLENQPWTPTRLILQGDENIHDSFENLSIAEDAARLVQEKNFDAAFEEIFSECPHLNIFRAEKSYEFGRGLWTRIIQRTAVCR